MEITVDTPDLNCNNVNNVSSLCCDIKYIMVGNDYQSKISTKNGNFELIVSLFNKYKYYDATIPLRIFGRVILFLHEWQEQTLISKYKSVHHC